MPERLTRIICGTEPMNDVWSPRATLQRMLDVEAVTLAPGDHIGRLAAHRRVEHASKTAVQPGRTLYDVLAADPDVASHLGAERLSTLLDPARYAGEAQAFVDALFASYAQRPPGSSSQTTRE